MPTLYQVAVALAGVTGFALGWAVAQARHLRQLRELLEVARLDAAAERENARASAAAGSGQRPGAGGAN